MEYALVQRTMIELTESEEMMLGVRSVPQMHLDERPLLADLRVRVPREQPPCP